MKEKLQKRFKDLQKKDKKGFTLIELIVVLVILGIILAITVPAVTGSIDDAKDAQHMGEARAVFMAAEVERTRDIAAGTVAKDAKWPATDNDKDTVVSDASTVKVTKVKYENKKYTFTLMDGANALKDVTVDPNKTITIADPATN